MNIKIHTLIGSGIKTYIPSMAKIRQEVLSEIEYLEPGGLETDLKYLKHVSMSKDAIAVLVFDGSKIVGISTGMPLAKEFPSFQEPFIEYGLPVEEYYYFGLSALLKPYRSRGIAHHFFDIREEHVRHLKRFAKICFTSTVPPKGYYVSAEHASRETFWQKRGYVKHPEMTCRYPIIDCHRVPTLHFWIKDFRLRPA